MGRLLVLVVSVVALGCGVEERIREPLLDYSHAVTRDELVIQPSLTWPQSTLRVCFRTWSISAEERAVIANAAHQWERATGLRFVGFGNCTLPIVTDAEIGIIQDEVLLPHGTGGPPYGAISLRIKYDNQPACRASEVAREQCLMSDAIHEFGHVLGFAHEQLRPDDGSRLAFLSTCSQQAFDGTWGVPDNLGPWDLYSVMNYCNPNERFAEDHLELSESDQHGAAWRYGRPNYFADFDGDGRADAIVVNGDSITVRRSTGSGFGPNQTISSVAYYGRQGTVFADVDGDGRADAIVVGDNEIVVRRSDGFVLGPYEQWSSVPYFGRHGTFFADVTGDGRADAIVVSEREVVVRRSLYPSSASFGPNEVWLSHSSFAPDSVVLMDGSPWTHIPFSFKIMFTNVTAGDSRSDLVMFTQGGVRVFRSTGSQFSTNAQIWQGMPFFGNRLTSVADINGDGRGDIVVSNEAGLASAIGVHARFSDGISSFKDQRELSGEYFGQRGTFFANVDGIPGDEAIVVNDDGIVVRRLLQTSACPAGPGCVYGDNEVWSGPFFSVSR